MVRLDDKMYVALCLSYSAHISMKKQNKKHVPCNYGHVKTYHNIMTYSLVVCIILEVIIITAYYVVTIVIYKKRHWDNTE